MKIYVFTITYNFSGDSFAKKCNTFQEAVEMLNSYLAAEVKVVKEENEYEPSILRWDDDDVMLIYAEGYSTVPAELKDGDFLKEDCAQYRIFEVEI